MADHVFPLVTLRTGRLLLRPFREADAPDVHAVWHDDEYLRYAPAGLTVAGADLETARRWCADGARPTRMASFAAVPFGSERLCGHVALYDADWAAMICEIHYWTAPWGRGNGYAAEAARAVAEWALRQRGFARVALNAVVDNVASRRVAETAGFRIEGILRNAALTRTGRGDLAAYSLIPGDLPEAGGAGA